MTPTELAALLAPHHTPLIGRHVRLEPMTAAATEGLWQAASRVGDSGRFTTFPKTHGETVRYVSAALDAKHAGSALPYVIVRLSTGSIVGSTRFANVERWDAEHGDPTRPRVLDSVEIGWTWLEADAQRTAVNTEAKLLLLTHAFEALGVGRVTLKTDARNTLSRAAIERIGATFEGLLRRHMPASDGGVRDTAMYSIIAPEWPRVRELLLDRLNARP
jgi:RimJ/RimL family protein N-acetyltransferase